MAKSPLDNYDDHDHPLRPIVAGWIRLIRRAWEHKKKEFQADADDIMVFFNGTKDEFWKSDWAKGARGYLGRDSEVPSPDFQMVLMKVAEAVQLFGPSLYANNPTVEINPVTPPPIPPESLGIVINPEVPTPEAMMYQQMSQQEQLKTSRNKVAAEVLEYLINYQMRELDAKVHARRAIDECLIKGGGVRWTELEEQVGTGVKMVGSFYDSIDNLVMDCDAECHEDVQWVARKRTMSLREAEKKFQLAPGTLDEYATHESAMQQEMAPKEQDYMSKQGRCCDLIVFWEIYSKMGMGDRIKGIPEGLKGEFEEYGDYCYLAVAECCPWPLNLPSHMLEKWKEDEAFIRAQWPIPFWADSKTNSWPFTMLSFHDVPGHIWPMSHFKPGMGELKWLTWAMSFLANKVRTSCGTLIGVMASAGQDLKNKLQESSDNKVIELEKILGDKIENVISYIQQPPFHGDIYKVIAAVFELWDKRVGLTELMYGMADTQDRSATTTSIRQENSSVRITDMLSSVESWAAEIASKEAMAVRWLISPNDVMPILGQMAGYVYATQVMSTSIEEVVREFTYTVAAGSTRMKNRQVKLANLNDFMTKFLPVTTGLIEMGQVGPFNAVMKRWADLMDEEVDDFLIQPPPPPDPMADPKLQVEMAKMQMEMQMEQARHEMEKETHQLELQAKALELQMKQQAEEQKLELERAKAELELEVARMKAQADMQQTMAKAVIDQQATQMKARTDMAVQQQQANTQMQAQQQKAATDREVAKTKADTQRQVAETKARTDIETTKAKSQADIANQKAKTQAGVESTQAKTKAAVSSQKAKAAAKPKPKK